MLNRWWKKEDSSQYTLYFNIVGKNYIWNEKYCLITYKYIRLDKAYEHNLFQTDTNVLHFRVPVSGISL